MFKFTKGQRVIFVSILVIISFILKELYGYLTVTIFFMMLSTAIAGFPIVKKMLGALKYRIIGIDALVTIAVTGAIIIGEYWEATAVTYLFMLGDYLEARTIEKTRSSIKDLLDLAPMQARIILDSKEIIVPIEEIKKSDRIIVKNGEKIAVDGRVIEGEAYVNQANITGESIPVGKMPNDMVYSGTVIESGYLVIEAERVGEDTTFARILHMVEEAQDKKAKTQKLIEKFAKYYTPLIIVLALVLYLITKNIKLSLTLLVIACPGALVISTPVSIVAGLGNGAKKGILIKGGEAMEKLGNVSVLAFDKTGTLTIGRPVVTKVKAIALDTKEVLTLAAIGEAYSEHPLAKAIIEKAGQVLSYPQNVKIITGKGLEFTYQKEKYILGNRQLFTKEVLADEETYFMAEEARGQTVVILGTTTKLLGLISISDQKRDGAQDVIHQLKQSGIKKTIMLTGDNQLVAKAISEELQIDEYYGELLPEDKVQVINQLQERYGNVAMVGDGVNDAPALASANLGIAVGGVGKDVAMETADVVLMSEDLQKINYAINLSKKTVINMKQNLYFSIFIALILLFGVLLNIVDLALGMLVHEVSVLLVIINAIRLRKYRIKP